MNNVIRPSKFLASIIAHTDEKPWDVVLTDTVNALKRETEASVEEFKQKHSDLQEKHDSLHAGTNQAFEQFAASCDACLEDLAKQVSGRLERLESDMREELSAAHARIAVLESRWYNRLAVWIRSLFS